MISTTGSLLLFPLLSYLLGAIPCGYLIARAKGIDIRRVGSGNIGATNVFRSIGKTWGLLTFLLDALKGFVPASIFPILAEKLFHQTAGNALPILCACCAVAGHNWPIYLRFKGGKGVATSAGALLGIAPKAVGIGLIGWIAVFLLTRYVSVASVAASMIAAAAAWSLYGTTRWGLPATLSLFGLVIIWRHKQNIGRLLKGTEHRFELRKRTPPPA